MLDRIKSLLRGAPPTTATARHDPLHVAVGALLIEAARRDDAFHDAERDAIARILTARFSLSDAAAQELLASAEERNAQSIELFSFTRGMVKGLDYEDRVHLIELLWEVAFADDTLDAHEDALIRKVAGLLYVSDFDRGAARRRVQERRTPARTG